MSIPQSGSVHARGLIRCGRPVSRAVSIAWVSIASGEGRVAIASAKSLVSTVQTITVSIAGICFSSWLGVSFTLVDTVDRYIGVGLRRVARIPVAIAKRSAI